MRKSQVVEEWREEGRAEALVATWQESLLTVLDNRFGPLPEDLIRRIQTIRDAEQLKADFRQALTVISLDQLSL